MSKCFWKCCQSSFIKYIFACLHLHTLLLHWLSPSLPTPRHMLASFCIFISLSCPMCTECFKNKKFQLVMFSKIFCVIFVWLCNCFFSVLQVLIDFVWDTSLMWCLFMAANHPPDLSFQSRLMILVMCQMSTQVQVYSIKYMWVWFI